MTRSTVVRAVGVSLLAFAAVLSCTADRRTPTENSPSPTSGGPPHGPQRAPGDPLGSFTLGAQANNNLPTPTQNTGISVLPGIPVLVVVNGKLEFNANGGFTSCSHLPVPPLPGNITSVGPAGFDQGNRPYAVVMGFGDAVNPPSSAFAIRPLSASSDVDSAFEQGPGVIWAGRPTVIPGACEGPGTGFQPTYFTSGSQSITVTELAPPTLDPDKTTVKVGDTVTFTMNLPWSTNFFILGPWSWVSDSGPSTAKLVSGCVLQTTCSMELHETGHALLERITIEGAISLNAVSPRVTVSACRFGVDSAGHCRPEEVTIKIDTVYGPLDSGSFTALAGEHTITLKATVTPDSLAPGIGWSVAVDPGSFAGTPLPSGPVTGSTATFAVSLPSNPRGRWPGTHPGALVDKQLGYEVQAAVAANGVTHLSDQRVVHQKERDVLREEYLEFGESPSPAVIDLGREETLHFHAGELNSGDYSIYWAQAVFRTGIETVRGLVQGDFSKHGLAFHGITMTSGFRNPVHHHIHLGASNRTNHAFGLAADFRITDQPLSPQQFFDRLRTYAHDPAVNGCFEPKHSIIAGSPTGTLDHAHLDWGTPCEQGW